MTVRNSDLLSANIAFTMAVVPSLRWPCLSKKSTLWCGLEVQKRKLKWLSLGGKISTTITLLVERWKIWNWVAALSGPTWTNLTSVRSPTSGAWLPRIWSTSSLVPAPELTILYTITSNWRSTPPSLSELDSRCSGLTPKPPKCSAGVYLSHYSS